jgi:hypothetical protein
VLTPRRWIPAALGAAGILGVVVVALLVTGGRAGMPDAAPEAAPNAAVSPTPTASASPNAFDAGGLQDPSVAAPAVDVGDPVSVQIPSLGIASSLEDLAIGPGGELAAPVDYDRAGWYADGPAPGEIGPAIIAGHVDSTTGPAVFYRVSELKDGDEIVVDTDTGESLTFVVTGRTQSAKATFPTADVYSNVPRPELRLITCAGFFDRSTGHYTDNLIVFASLKG